MEFSFCDSWNGRIILGVALDVTHGLDCIFLGFECLCFLRLIVCYFSVSCLGLGLLNPFLLFHVLVLTSY